MGDTERTGETAADGERVGVAKRRAARWGRHGAGMMVVGGVMGFVAIAADVVGHGWLWRMDEPVRRYLHEHASAAGVTAASVVSGLGDGQVITGVGVLVGLWLLRRGRWREALVWALGLVGSGVICESLKGVFQVPRPMAHTFFAFVAGAGYSFPSGHTMAVTVTCGLLTLVLWGGAGRAPRWAMVVGTMAVSAVVGFGLMFVGVHALSEVLGAQMVAVAWLGVLRILMARAATGGAAD
jgi:membrane-associated phospholipid phosphatase